MFLWLVLQFSMNVYLELYSLANTQTPKINVFIRANPIGRKHIFCTSASVFQHIQFKIVDTTLKCQVSQSEPCVNSFVHELTLKWHTATQETFSSQVGKFGHYMFKGLYHPHSFLYWCKPTQIKANTWHFNTLSIILFQIECAEAQSLKNKKMCNYPNTSSLDCKLLF